jgi:hypothetical protein
MHKLRVMLHITFLSHKYSTRLTLWQSEPTFGFFNFFFYFTKANIKIDLELSRQYYVIKMYGLKNNKNLDS